MLSGVRTGKKKRKRPPPAATAQSSTGASAPAAAASPSAAAAPAPVSSLSSKSKSKLANVAAAEALRRSLGLTGRRTCGGGSGGGKAPDGGAEGGGGGRGGGGGGSAWDELERRGRIRTLDSRSAASADGSRGSGNDDDVILTAAASSSAPLSREDFRRGARRGRVSKHAARASASESAREMTVEEMAAEERSSSRTMDEAYARNVARLGSRYKGSEFAPGSRSGADEEDYTGEVGGADTSMFAEKSDRLTEAERASRERSRQISLHDKQSAISAKCWWWASSPSFKRHTLLALGDHVSMVLCPSHLSLVDHQAILVPVRHGESFSGIDEEVWDEVVRFKSSLRRMWRARGKGVIFLETVLPHKGFWQARMECVPVPRRVAEDAPIYFKSALTEQAEEWGTHTKILSTRDRGLRRTVPKSFPYFHVEWSEGEGYAQIIESSQFPRDFGLDTIAGMMGMDPMKFHRKRRAADEDRGVVLKFVEMWREFDWTVELDATDDAAAADDVVPAGGNGGGR